MIEVDLEATDMEADLEASELAAGPGGGDDGYGGAGALLDDDDDDELDALGLEPSGDNDDGWDVTVEDVDGWIGAVLAAEDGDFEDEGDLDEEDDDGRPATRRGGVSS